jgi:hypothetical protein
VLAAGFAARDAGAAVLTFFVAGATARLGAIALLQRSVERSWCLYCGIFANDALPAMSLSI